MTMRARPRGKAPSARRLKNDLVAANDLLGIRREELRLSGERANELARRLEQTENVLADSADRLAAAREREQLDNEFILRLREETVMVRRSRNALADELDKTRERLNAQTDQARNAAGAAAVLAYLVMPSAALNEILASFEETAARMNIGPEVKDAAKAALKRASAAFVSGEWPTDHLERELAAGVDPMVMLEMLSRGHSPYAEEDLVDMFGSGFRGRRSGTGTGFPG